MKTTETALPGAITTRRPPAAETKTIPIASLPDDIVTTMTTKRSAVVVKGGIEIVEMTLQIGRVEGIEIATTTIADIENEATMMMNQRGEETRRTRSE